MANITTQTIRVDLSTGKIIPTAYTHQNDTARTLVFDMYNGGLPYTMTGNTVKFAYKSPIVNGQYSVIAGSSMASGTVSGNKVTVTLPSTYTAISGVGMLTMVITPTSGTIRPVNIRLVVQKSADGADVVAGASDFPITLKNYADSWMYNNADLSIYYPIMQEWLEDHPDAVDGLVLGYVTPQMFGAVADGVTDDTQAIQDAFDAGHCIFFPDGTYLVDGNVSGFGHSDEGGVFPKSNSMVFLSNNAVLKAKTNSTGHYRVLNLYNVNNVTIIGGKIQGEKDTHSGTSGEWGHGIRINECEYITIRDMEIYNCWGDGVCLASTDELTGSNKHCVIDNCYIHDCRRQGISVVIGSDTVISKCEISNIAGTAPQSGIDLESNGTEEISNTKIDNCYIHDTVGDSIISANDKTVGVLIDNCVFDKINSVGGDGIVVSNSRFVTVLDGCNSMQFDNCDLEFIYIASGNARFSNCRIIGNINGSDLISQRRLGTIFFSTDHTRSGEIVTFCDCYISTESTNLVHYAYTQSRVDKKLGIYNCNIVLTSGFMNMLPNEELDLIGCTIENCKAAYLFSARYSSDELILMMHNNSFIDATAADYLLYFSSSAAGKIKALLSGNVLNYVRLCYDGSGTSEGTILMTGNMIFGSDSTTAHQIVSSGSGLTVQNSNDVLL